MNCYDCAVTADHRAAVAVCADCGAGVCLEHAVSNRHWLTRGAPINRAVPVDPPARVIRCGTCQAAHAARGDVAPTTGVHATAGALRHRRAS